MFVKKHDDDDDDNESRPHVHVRNVGVDCAASSLEQFFG